MRTRIIFRGLTLFTFETPSKGAQHGDNLGTLTALLVSDPVHAGMPPHQHTPKAGWIGRRGSPGASGDQEPKAVIPTDLTIELRGDATIPAGVNVDQSFLEYVPCLGEIHPNDPGAVQNTFILRRIIIPSGTIRAGEFITWNNAPARVGYMDTGVRAFAANEVIVDIGNDLDIETDDLTKFLSVTGTGVDEKLWPRVKGAAKDEDIDPNTVEVLITNLTARRRRPVFWSRHYRSLFDAAGYPGTSPYNKTPEFIALETAAKAYDDYEWGSDDFVPAGQPFPFLVDLLTGSGAPIDPANQPLIVTGPPKSHGRQNNEGKPTAHLPHAGGSMGTTAGRGPHTHTSGPGKDPENTQICPHGRE